MTVEKGLPSAALLSAFPDGEAIALQVAVLAARIFELPHSRILGRDRSADAFEARSAAIAVAREITHLSYPALGQVFGGRDHSTVIRSVEMIEVLQMRSARFKRRLARLRLLSPALVNTAAHIIHAEEDGEDVFAELAIVFVKAQRLDPHRAATILATLAVPAPAE